MTKYEIPTHERKEGEGSQGFFGVPHQPAIRCIIKTSIARDVRLNASNMFIYVMLI